MRLPYALDQWDASVHNIRQITLDTNCVNAKQADPHLNQLESWENAGLVDLRRAPAFLQELRGSSRRAKAESISPLPPPFTFPHTFGGPGVLVGPSQRESVRRILFPTTAELSPQQEADVEHLVEHNTVGGELFVTLDTSDFIRLGKQEELASLGIWVFSPSRAVQFLVELYGWEVDSPAA